MVNAQIFVEFARNWRDTVTMLSVVKYDAVKKKKTSPPRRTLEEGKREGKISIS